MARADEFTLDGTQIDPTSHYPSEKRSSKRGCGIGLCGGCAIGCFTVVVLSLIAIGIAFYVVAKKLESSFTEDPTRAAAWLQNIAPSQVPDGYEAKGAVDLDFWGFFDVAGVLIAPKNISLEEVGSLFEDNDDKPSADDEKQDKDKPADMKPDAEPKEKQAIFLLIKMPNWNDPQVLEQINKEMARVGVENLENKREFRETQVVRTIDGKRIQLTKTTAIKENGKRIVSYTVNVKARIVLKTFGTEDRFDYQAMDKLLASLQFGDGFGAPGEGAVEEPALPLPAPIEKETKKAKDAVPKAGEERKKAG